MSLITKSMFENVQFGIIFNSKLVKNFNIDSFQYLPVIIRIFKRNPLQALGYFFRLFYMYGLVRWFDNLE